MSHRSALSRRDFIRGGAAAGAAFALPGIAPAVFGAGNKTISPGRAEVAAIYCPLWHRYDHMDAWHGYGWCEWELLKSAPARFPGHYQPLRPSWGFFNEWKAMAATALPHCPVVTMGWDVTPRCEHNVPFPFAKPKYPYGHIVVGNAPERFGRLCKLAAEHVAADSKRPPAVFVNAWNEWTEGSYLLPEEKHGTAYLKALQRAFRGR
jgi:hypothetical protein